MEQVEQLRTDNSTRELVTFRIGQALCGIDILKVQEINKLRDWTSVPHAPDYVLGILSIRGDIVTVMDLGKRLGLDGCCVDENCRNIIVDSEDEYVGLLVDEIGDVETVNYEQLCSVPANSHGIQSKFIEAVLKTEEKLIAILDTEKLLNDHKQEKNDS